MSNLNICIDIDGTITSPYHFIPYLNDICQKNITEEECITLDWKELYNQDMEDILKKLHNEYIHVYKEAELVENVKETLEELKINNNLYFVTARSEILTDITKEWLIEKGIHNIDVHLLGSDYKIEKAKELNCNLFLEDNPDNAIQIANAGIDVILMDANYNKEINHERITRVKNWNEVKELIISKY